MKQYSALNALGLSFYSKPLYQDVVTAIAESTMSGESLFTPALRVVGGRDHAGAPETRRGLFENLVVHHLARLCAHARQIGWITVNEGCALAGAGLHDCRERTSA